MTLQVANHHNQSQVVDSWASLEGQFGHQMSRLEQGHSEHKGRSKHRVKASLRNAVQSLEQVWPDTLDTESSCQKENANHSDLAQIADSLKNASKTGKWLVLVSPKHKPTKQELQSMGLGNQQVLVVHQLKNNSLADTLTTLDQHQTASAIVCWPTSETTIPVTQTPLFPLGNQHPQMELFARH